MSSFQDSRLGNYFIGISLVCIFFAGLPANIIAFTYFLSRQSRRPNSKFFKITYMIITTIDTLILIALVPVIEATFQPYRAGKLFNNNCFCQLWGTLWAILPNMSIFMVCVLSVSRYIVLSHSTVRLNKKLSWLIPLMCLAVILLMLLITYSGKIVTMTYRPQYFLCGPKGFEKPGETDSHKVLLLALINSILFTSIAGLTFIPITVSFCLTIHKLRRIRVLSSGIGASTNRQYHASCTVMIVTFIYMIFNLPFSLAATGFLVKICNLYFSYGEDWQRGYDLFKEEGSPAMNTAAVLFFLVFIAANSAVNPFIYFSRMNNFRRYVQFVMGDRTAVIMNSL